MNTEPNKVIYSMVGVSKYYDKRAVLKDIYLSYFYGAKIGVIGPTDRASPRFCASSQA
jgi:sulfate-transporting ATPase